MNSSAPLGYKEPVSMQPVSLRPAAALLVAAVALAGCGSAPEVPAETVEAISYGSFGTSADIDCGSGGSLSIDGSNNTLTVTGRCDSLRVRGADNKITAQRIDRELSVPGLNNTVSYRDGDPSVYDSGSGNRITKG